MRRTASALLTLLREASSVEGVGASGLVRPEAVGKEEGAAKGFAGSERLRGVVID